MANDSNVAEALHPVFLELGRTVYICQCFESSLCFLLALISHEAAGHEPGAFQAGWDFHSNKTLGGLVNALRDKIDVPEDLEAFLSEGVKVRNSVVHGYLTANANRLVDPKGRLEIEQELVKLKSEVKRRDVAVNKLIDALLAKLGTSNAELKANADRLWDHLNSEESNGAKDVH